MFDVGFWEIFIIALILLIVLGPERLPPLAKKVGGYVRKIKEFTSNINEEISSELNVEKIKDEFSMDSLNDENSKILEIAEKSKDSLNKIKTIVEDK